MTLADSIVALTRHLTTKVWVNFILLRPSDPTDPSGVPGVSAIRISKSYESPVPLARIEVSRIPDWIQPGMSLLIELGYDIPVVLE